MRRRGRARLALVLAMFAFVGCSSGEPRVGTPDSVASYDPEFRSVRIETEGCRFASGSTGSGVAIGGDLIVTVAHLIVRTASVEGEVGSSGREPLEVVAVDLQRDLALLRSPSLDVSEVEMITVAKGQSGLIVGGAASGTVPFEVTRRVNLTIEEILGTDRHSRLGYEVAASTRDGDSGAGAYDDEDRLIGLVFATGQDQGSSWLTATSEIEAFLSTVDPSDTYAPCL